MDIQSEAKLDKWSDIKIFRDPVHQYIELPKAYVSSLIDTPDMQRIKDVAQSGLRSVYNAATHDRFSHSLGVYHLGKKAFTSLKTNLINIINKAEFKPKSGNRQPLKTMLDLDQVFRTELDKWEVLFHIACILHDIGHPAMSHTLEFLYDDIYMDLDGDCACPITVSLKEYERYKKLHDEFRSKSESSELKTSLQVQLSKRLLGNEDERLYGNPHEKMSAYYILSGLVQDEKGEIIFTSPSLANNIKQLLESYHEHCGKRVLSISDEKQVDREYAEDIKFICRMIIGQLYAVDTTNVVDNIKNSIRNAIICLLNGKIDVDSLDYIARNSYSAGYDTNSVDVNRMCTAYSVRFQNNLFTPVFEKNALSVLEGFISARNFEPRWLYSHHKIVYNIDVLYKSMYKCAVELLYAEDVGKWADILKENMYSDGGRKPEVDFYKEYIEKMQSGQVDRAGKVNASFSDEDKVNIINSLAKISYGKTIEDDFLKIYIDKDNKYDIEIRQTALFIARKIHSNEEQQEEQQAFYSDLIQPNEPLEKLLEKLLDKLNRDKEIKELCESVPDYIMIRNDIEKMLYMLFKAQSKDFRDTIIEKMVLQTRQYLVSLKSESAGQTKTYREIQENKDDFFCFIEALLNRYAELIDMENLYFSYVLSPFKGFDNEKYFFYRSNDSDVNALFKKLYYRIMAKKLLLDQKGEKLLPIEKDFYDLATEYFQRTYKQSLWKSYQEYKIFLDEIAVEINMDAAVINEYFLNLIKYGGNRIVFQNNNQVGTNSNYVEQAIYKNYSPKEALYSNTPLQSEFRDVFADLADLDFVIKIHSIKYKDFRKPVKIAFKEKVFPLGEIIDMADLKDIEFPYVFLKLPDEEEPVKAKRRESEKSEHKKTRREYLESLRDRLKDYCVRVAQGEFIIKKEASDSIMAYNGGKLFRDVVHGDIVVPREFLLLIETEAFQRLRRIKQLSTADLVFPNATHTRFSHCIGTFHIMTLIVDHFKVIFKNLGVSYQQKDIDALLVAALLHDIGHGPYSHNFERLPENKKSHEVWSTEIIESDNEIFQALKEGFPGYETEEFIKLIKSYIIEESSDDDKQLSFHVIFKSLISSQIDADRFDYLLRDSFNTGIGYGKIDVNSIIRAMQVTEYRNKFYVCISEDAISYIEQFLFGRYKMYDSVYYSAYKVFSESLILNILTYVRNKADGLKDALDDNITALLNNDLELDKYLTLDDSYITGLFSKWQRSEDAVLAEMCKSLLQRRGYERLYIMNQSKVDLLHFRQELNKLFRDYFQDSVKVDSLNSFIFAEREFTAYKYISATATKPANYDSKIWILTNNGLLKDFVDVSPMFSADKKDSTWATYKCFIYYNKKLLQRELEGLDELQDCQEKVPELLAHIDQLIRNLNLRNYIEIEEKYTCTLQELQRVKEALDEAQSELFENYKIISPKEIEQKDIYYDTDDMELAGNDCSFRCRSKSDGSHKITIKAPTPNGGFDKESQVARFEYEKEISTDQLTDAIDFVRSTLKNVIPNRAADLTESNFYEIFKSQIEVDNHRSKYLIRSAADEGQFEFSVCLDRVTFRHDGEEKEDYQIEVELESDYIHRVSMKFFTEKIEKLLDAPVQHEKFSKYKKGLKAFGLLKSAGTQ